MISYSENIARFSTALADPTRREVMDFVLSSEEPISVREVAEHFGLHSNVARMHLEKLVRGGILEVVRRRASRGGRPAHLYRASDEDWELQVPPRRYKLLAEILAKGISAAKKDMPRLMITESFRCGREEAMSCSSPLAYLPPGAGAPEVIETWLDEVKRRGIKAKVRNVDGQDTKLVFMSCPFGEFSRRYPGLVCEIHRSLEEGFLSLAGEWRVNAIKDKGECVFSVDKAHEDK